MADDNQTDAGDVGTPELTSPRLHLPPIPRVPAGQGRPGGIAPRDPAASLRAGGTPGRPRQVAFDL